MQLVLSNNRILAHGENFFYMGGGVVINTETGTKYENATVAECSDCPSDIDAVGYEYHAGRFVPCAPFGVGTGNVAVYCDDCKTPRDSGIHISDVAKKTTLLWENASPSSKFDASTVYLSSDNFDFVIVEFYNGLNAIFSRGYNSKFVQTLMREQNNYDDGYGYWFYSRSIHVYKDYAQIYFGSGFESWFRLDLEEIITNSEQNDVLKPYKIYGVRI